MKKLSEFQKFFVAAGSAALIAMCLFPPWASTDGIANGYGFVLSPPTASKIDLPRLLPLMAAVAFAVAVSLFSGIFYDLGHDKPKPSPESSTEIRANRADGMSSR